VAGDELCTRRRMTDEQRNDEPEYGSPGPGRSRRDLGGFLPGQRPAVLDARHGTRGPVPRGTANGGGHLRRAGRVPGRLPAGRWRARDGAPRSGTAVRAVRDGPPPPLPSGYRGAWESQLRLVRSTRPSASSTDWRRGTRLPRSCGPRGPRGRPSRDGGGPTGWSVTRSRERRPGGRAADTLSGCEGDGPRGEVTPDRAPEGAARDRFPGAGCVRSGVGPLAHTERGRGTVPPLRSTGGRGGGVRILVERLWPRGLTRERAAVDLCG
jgi:hypothetical protein